MARYLLVAHQTATSPLVIERAREIQAGDPDAAFTILVPEAHVERLLVCDEPATREAARHRAGEATEAFEDAGLPVLHAEVGDSNPLQAITDELRRHPAEHDAVILSTFPPGRSRWLRLDLLRRIRNQYTLPVLQVYEGDDEVWQASESVRDAIAHGRPAPLPEARARRIDRLWNRLPGNISFPVALAVLLVVHLALGAGLAITQDLRFLGVEVAFLLIVAALIPPLRSSGGRRPEDASAREAYQAR